jgi:hypothetical protein
MFGTMQVAKRIPFEDKPEYIIYARIAYVAAQLLCLLINYYCTFMVGYNESAENRDCANL